ncbi:DUF4381 domain-containing protein [Joostella sp.]|uniref:DUF4381 domain-containing protein n=1 Tax=Joostella sp. TaxID=2231138 RepID=UPI003A9477B9
MIGVQQITDTIQKDSIPDELKSLQLEKLYEPDPIPFTFETVGWKILAVIVVLVLCISAYFMIRNYRRNAYRREALNKLKVVNSIGETLAILKIVAIRTFGRDEVGSLYGKSWLEFLDRTGKGVAFLSLEKDIEATVYKSDMASDKQKAAILLNSKKWIKTHA